MNVGQVAALAGVTVRTLHHYDRIGLLSPSGRTAAGYRRYAPSDLDRLHQVLVYRELGFPLEEVATLLDDPTADPAEHLRRQHRLLLDRMERTRAMVAAVEKEMEARQMGISLTPEERFELFGDWLPEEYEAEAEERWGDTEAWAQSQRRTRSYTKEDWVRIKAEGDDVERRFAEAMRSGVPAHSEQAMDVAEEHRQLISRNFYDCPPEVHAGLGRMYVEDERFTAHYEQVAPGLAQYVSTAVQANAARQGG
ncbi:MerR family transcriptional regulator [Geodermatophilus obscurus]|uniref:Transcriptional regulator, MerR family n=1 Tax=Geodermatophilus obscurus (strain ATCC 25078 / DSM 43160 / JCM 3152 / CCUG 61914 / KCC A-0152 / KCTC 9177 / NBRC 13315 / NRRL B-3577 / G-20) TaxID=526225 RepID=D2S430_GEOOG|nr:MerR family transcriptional regulator [Geodermatophilus obscurus]ADB73058.1 transcriptional regulator, MerR family [Geodermatophilus obscurus DSM 43160]